MDENDIHNLGFYLDNYPYTNNMSNYNLPEINKSKNNFTKIYLKFNNRLIISIIIFTICTTSHVINQKGLLSITNPSKINELSDNEFNITKLLISNNTCKDYDLISFPNIKRYFENIGNYALYKKINIFLTRISFICSLILLSIMYYININFVKNKKENKFIKLSSFIICIILLINEFIIFILYLALFLRIYEIIIYIQKNIENKCIIILTWDYTIKLLKNLIKTILIFSFFKICNIQLNVYFLKQLIVLNNFFNYDENNEEEIEIKKYDFKRDFSFNNDFNSIKQ